MFLKAMYKINEVKVKSRWVTGMKLQILIFSLVFHKTLTTEKLPCVKRGGMAGD